MTAPHGLHAGPAGRAEARLLAIHPDSGEAYVTGFDRLAALLDPGDLLVVNDAATLPASFAGTLGGETVEVRLASAEPWRAVVFGRGDWRQRTEDRPDPPTIETGDEIVFDGIVASVTHVMCRRLVTLEFDRDGDDLWAALYAAGRPVQYSYLARDLRLADVQTPYGARPWAVEMPSAGRPLGVGALIALRRRGVDVRALTHAAGLSATGDHALDRALPFPERYEIPAPTWEAARAARRVVAVGTSVARALESAARTGVLAGTTELVLDRGVPLRLTRGLLSGIHAPGESHWRVLRAFAGDEVLARAASTAAREGLFVHEFGDASLILAAPGRPR
ncbi:MAG: S-adenosylmethionine:tRNA ribosyltransferase-isomerase [Myxococcota bacterium]